jgi:predicted GNAT family acetyltransferase
VDNHNARRVYERLGFTTRRIAHFVAVRAPAP